VLEEEGWVDAAGVPVCVRAGPAKTAATAKTKRDER